MNTDKNKPQKIRRGRPRSLGIIEADCYDVKDYNKSYYERVYKEKTKGDYLCIMCNVFCSVANKSRHNKGKVHKDNEQDFIKQSIDDYLKFEKDSLIV